MRDKSVKCPERLISWLKDSFWSKYPQSEFVTCKEDKEGQFMEKCFPLGDPKLKGIQMCARVYYDKGHPSNRLVLKKGTKEASIKCLHTAVTTLTPEEIARASTEDFIELAKSSEFEPIKLPAEEHFASLRMYAAGLAETTNFEDLFLRTFENDAVTMTFGFNSAMQMQITRALNQVAPGWTKNFEVNLFARLLDQFGSEWLQLNSPDYLEAVFNYYERAKPENKDAPYRGLFEEVPLFRMYVAQQETEPRKLAAMVSDPYTNVRSSLPYNEHTPPDVLDVLLDDPSLYVRGAVAKKSSKLEHLLKLREDPEKHVRDSLVDNPNTPPEMLVEMYEEWREALPVSEIHELRPQDQHFLVQFLLNSNFPAEKLEEVIQWAVPGQTEWKTQMTLGAVYSNPNVPPLLIERAYTKAKRMGDLERVRALAKNPALPVIMIREIYQNYPQEGIRMEIGANPGTPKPLLQKMSRDSNRVVRLYVAKNVKAPIQVLKRLEQDEDEYVRMNAQETLKKIAS